MAIRKNENPEVTIKIGHKSTSALVGSGHGDGLTRGHGDPPRIPASARLRVLF